MKDFTLKIHRNHHHPEHAVYFLKKRGKIIYIGQSMRVSRRIRSHTVKGFDEVEVFPFSPYGLKLVEKEMIAKHNPPRNGNCCDTKTIIIPASLHTKLKKYAVKNGLFISTACEQILWAAYKRDKKQLKISALK